MDVSPAQLQEDSVNIKQPPARQTAPDGPVCPSGSRVATEPPSACTTVTGFGPGHRGWARSETQGSTQPSEGRPDRLGVGVGTDPHTWGCFFPTRGSKVSLLGAIDQDPELRA